MKDFINRIDFGKVAVTTRDPFTVTIESLKTSGTEIVSALRFEYPPVDGDSGVDVKASVTISGQVVTVEDLWTELETKTTGVKRLEVIAKNSDETAQDPVNIFFNVV